MVDIPVNLSDATIDVVVTTNGQTLFDFDWLAYATEQVHGIFRRANGTNIPLVPGVDFTVAGLSQPNGGSITLTTILDAVINEVVTIYRATPIKRVNDYQQSGDYFASVVNMEEDIQFMIMQELRRDADRAVKVPLGQTGISIIPGPDGSIPQYDANGNLTGYVDADQIGNAQNWAQRSRAWAVTGEDIPVNDTVNPPGFSAFHYSEKSREQKELAVMAEAKAELWAEEAEDIPVEPGKYSAHHWADKAEDFAASAASYVSDRPKYVTDRAALKLLNPTVEKAVYIINEGGRTGLFLSRLIASLSAPTQALVATDATREGIYVVSTQNPAYVYIRSYSGWPLARWWGDDQAGVAAAINIVKDIRIDQPLSITSNMTLPLTHRFSLTSDATITVSAGQTLTVFGKFYAPLKQVFFGAGLVAAIRKVYPEWFGAVRDGATDDAPAIQRAHNCAVANPSGWNGRWAELKFSRGMYGLGSGLVFTPTGSVPLKVSGAGIAGSPQNGGTLLLCLNAFSGTVAVNLQGQSNASAERIANWEIRDFGIDRQSASGAIVGFYAGGNGANLNLVGSQQSLIENVYIRGFQVCWKVKHYRLCTFRRCSGWSETLAGAVGLELAVDDVNLFTGDCDFRECQFIAAFQANSANVYAHVDATNAIMNGIRFFGCIFYKGATSFAVNNADGQMGDWWVTDCQFDGQLGTVFDFTRSGNNSQIFNWHINNNYAQGINGPFFKTLLTGTGYFRSIFVTNNWVRGGTLLGNELFRMSGAMSGIMICNNIFEAISSSNANGLIVFYDLAKSLHVIGNAVMNFNGATAPKFVTFGTTATGYICHSNSGFFDGAITGAMVTELNGSAVKYAPVGGNI